MMQVWKERFEKHPERHPGLDWTAVERRLQRAPDALQILCRMEETGGEPDVIAVEADGTLLFADCSPETPAGRRNVCYDEAARIARKKNAPASSAEEQAAAIGASLLDEAQYRHLQTLGRFDQKTSSWIATPPAIRALGGALFCERRYETVFTFHNGADSYYGVRGWRGCVRV